MQLGGYRGRWSLFV